MLLHQFFSPEDRGGITGLARVHKSASEKKHQNEQEIVFKGGKDY